MKKAIMTTSPVKKLTLIFVLSFLYSPMAIAGGNHPHGATSHNKDHTHEDSAPANVVTQYNDYTELFVEFPPLVINQKTTFITHFTRLSDFKAVDEGVLDVVLTKNNKTVVRFRVREPARSGIFLPDVTPNQSGQFGLVLELKTNDWISRHDLGQITVFENSKNTQIEKNAPSGEVSYLKEQQWQNPFAIAKSAIIEMRPSVPGFGTVSAPLNEFTVIRAPDDGYFSSGKIISAGESVSVNDALGSLIPRLGEDTDIGELIVDVERAKSRFELAKADVKRLEKLFNKGSVSEKLFLEAQKERDIAAVELQTTQSRLRQRAGGVETAGINIVAPIQGEVLSVYVHPGSFVREGDPLFSIAGKNMRWMNVQVPEKFSGEIHKATGIWFEFKSQPLVLDTNNQASIVKVSREVKHPARTVEVAVAYPSTLGPSIIGVRLPVRVFVGAPVQRLAIPASAIIDDNGQSVVYVQVGGESFERRVVTLGIRDSDLVEVTSGLSPDEWVVSRGAYYVKLASTGGDAIGHGHAH
ncbi:efflux RND transporter periplasmic adaptor subunit [Pleionea sediminis]|uniref:efflux RND transporter periplasmic adaptor subunit n=1 Tax=Pleionea sediminis TaxID=2569479 RepID=UPI0013DE4E8F|nr:efflux RND transporter periplasmic adaptor subunit [Pleionea sediminis]